VWWRRRSGITALERAEAERQALADLLAEFAVVCKAAGVKWRVPPSLIAAATVLSPGGQPVVIEAAGRRVIAVAGPGGDPREWMPAIMAVATVPLPSSRITRVEHAALPPGLMALVAVPAAGGIAVLVSQDLPAPVATAAARSAIAAAKRNGWHGSRTAGLLPIAGAAIAWHVAAIPPKAAVAGASVAAVAAAGVLVAVLPAHPAAPQHPAALAPVTAPRHAGHPRHHAVPPARVPVLVKMRPSSSAHAAIGSGSPQPHPTRPAPQPPSHAPAPSPSSSTPAPSQSPTPTPTPSPSPGHHHPPGICIGLIIIGACISL
jgi:hypothetical protein